MRDTGELKVVMLHDKAWERLEMVPIAEPVPLDVWLTWVREEGMQISAEPHGRIEGGAYDGGRVLTLDNETGRSYCAVPAAAIPLLCASISGPNDEGLLAWVNEGTDRGGHSGPSGGSR